MDKVLIVVDMQNDFIDGTLKNPDALAIAKNLANFISQWHGHIIFTRDTHDENYLETQEGKKLPIKHCIVDTSGWEVNQTIFNAAANNENATIDIIDKPTFGAGLILYNAVNKLKNVNDIVVCGTCTDICVVSNALELKTFFPKANVSVLSELCAGLTKEKHEAALEVMRSCQIEVL